MIHHLSHIYGVASLFFRRIPARPANRTCERRNRIRRSGMERVYFVKDLVTGYIKIGRSLNPHARLKALQTGNPNQLIILATINGGQIKESEIHRRFTNTGFSGEWFHPTEELMKYIETSTKVTRKGRLVLDSLKVDAQ